MCLEWDLCVPTHVSTSVLKRALSHSKKTYVSVQGYLYETFVICIELFFA